MSAGPTHKQLLDAKRRMAHYVRILANARGYQADIEAAKPMKKTDRGDGFGPLVRLIKPESHRTVGTVLCTSIHASNGEASGYYVATRTSDGRTHCTINAVEAVNFALGPEFARKHTFENSLK